MSSIVVSGTPITRPHGFLVDGYSGAKFTSSKKLDYEVEVGVFVSKSIPFGTIVPASKAQEHIFGLVLLND
jgi:fumarylacetoacetase